MRFTRLLTILGPAAVLYLLAARASAGSSVSPQWPIGVWSLALALAPLSVAGARPSRRLSSVALMGVSLALAIASARTSSPSLERTHDLAWLVAGLLMLDLALPRQIRPVVRACMVGGFALAALAAAALAGAGLVPPVAFGVVVVAGLLVVAALHQVVLVGRGHSFEGAASGVAIVGLAVGLAYAWIGPLTGLAATTVEITVASLLWLGHLAWVDPRWRSLRRIGVPVVIASGVSFVLASTLAPSDPLDRWGVGMLAVVSGMSWWVAFTLAHKLLRRAIWTTSGRLADAATRARRQLVGSVTIDDITTAVLVPLSEVFDDPKAQCELHAFDPPLRARLDEGNRPNVRFGEAPSPVVDELQKRGFKGALDLAVLRSRVVREPAIRALVELMESRAIGAILPCVHLDHPEGMLVLPLGDRSEPLSRHDLEELSLLCHALGGALASALAERRAETHVHRLSELKREADAQIAKLKEEVGQLRDQCDVLGRGLSEERTLHIAYSPSMRRVQMRAIELAPTEEPILLIAAAGSPVLPVSRFIHDRGPRWEAPFVVADCSASVPDEVMSLLFGADGQRGGWFHSATGGTLLLRDLPALPRTAQARLAAALNARASEPTEHRPVPPRIIATSRTALQRLRTEDALDPDLERCLADGCLLIPSLRERREDVPSLALLAIDRACRILGRDPIGIEQRAMAALVDHDWPGDVAELELVIELAVGRASGKTISTSDLPPLVGPEGGDGESLDGTYIEVERRLLERALRRSGGNKSEAARRLGLKRTTFLDKLRRHDLERRSTDNLSGSAMG